MDTTVPSSSPPGSPGPWAARAARAASAMLAAAAGRFAFSGAPADRTTMPVATSIRAAAWTPPTATICRSDSSRLDISPPTRENHASLPEARNPTGGSAAQGSFHRWLVPSLQDQMSS